MSLVVHSITALAAQGRWRTEAMRSHSSPRLLWISRGQGRIVIAGQTRGYGPNNLIYIPPGTLHGYEVGPGAQGLQISLPREMARDWPDEPLHLRLRDVRSQRELTAVIDNLERELNSHKPGSDRAAEHHAGLLGVFVERQLDEDDDAALPETAATRLAEAYSALIARDYQTARGVADYAAELGVTPTHLTRCCRQACGRSALALLNDRVLYAARRRLAETPEPIGGIAKALGFSSPAYFTRAFQSGTGQSPSAFRKSARLAR